MSQLLALFITLHIHARDEGNLMKCLEFP